MVDADEASLVERFLETVYHLPGIEQDEFGRKRFVTQEVVLNNGFREIVFDNSLEAISQNKIVDTDQYSQHATFEWLISIATHENI